MKNTLDIEAIVWGALNDAGIGDVISGGIYRNGQRPANSTDEDIIISAIALTSDSTPQIGTVNVNIYVADKSVNVNGVTMLIPDNDRMTYIADVVNATLRSCVVTGIGVNPTSEVVIAEQNMKQHYVNIRVNLNIQI